MIGDQAEQGEALPRCGLVTPCGYFFLWRELLRSAPEYAGASLQNGSRSLTPGVNI